MENLFAVELTDLEQHVTDGTNGNEAAALQLDGFFDELNCHRTRESESVCSEWVARARHVERRAMREPHLWTVFVGCLRTAAHSPSARVRCRDVI